MKELSRTELRRLIAEKVYNEKGFMWCSDCEEYLYLDGTPFNPDEIPWQANEALEAWRKQDINEREYRIESGRCKGGWPKCGLSKKYREFDPWMVDYTGYNESLLTAICLALASAVTGEQCTLKELR